MQEGWKMRGNYVIANICHIFLLQVKLDDRNSCNACRYNECLRNGMRPQLVLSEDQIQERFKNLDKERKKKKTQKSRKPVQDLPRYVLILHEYYTKILNL